MPLYFGSDNKIYDSDLDGSTSYAGNTADYKPINYSTYENIIKNNLKNKAIFFNNIDENYNVTGVVKKPFLLSPNEKIQHFKNLTDYYINKNKNFVGFEGDLTEYLTSSLTGISSDATAFLNWRNDVIQYRNQKINDFQTGITSGVPTLSEFINKKEFPLLSSYRNGLFTGGINNEPPIMGLIIATGGAGPEITPGYTSFCRDGGTSDCCLVRTDTIVSEDHQVFDETMSDDWTFYQDGSFNPSPDVDLTGGVSFIFPEPFYEEMENIMKSPTGQEEFETFFENYFVGGNSEVVKYPTMKLIQKNANGSTSDVWVTIFPKFTPAGGIGAGGVVVPDGTTYVSHPRSIEVWTQEIWDAFVLSYIGLSEVNWCCDDMVKEVPATADFYDPEENPCGISDICQWCNIMVSYGFKMYGPHRCPMNQYNSVEYYTYDRKTGRKRDWNFPGPGYYPRTKEIRDRLIPVEDRGGDPNLPPDPNGDNCIRSEDKTGEKFLESPCYQPSCHSLGRCYECYEGTVASVATREKRISYNNKFILSHRKVADPIGGVTPTKFSCYTIDLNFLFYCTGAQAIKHAQSCGCDYCPCDNPACDGLTCSEELTKIPEIQNPNTYE